MIATSVIPALLPEDMPANARNGVIAAVATFGASVLQSNGVSALGADDAMPALAGVASQTTRKYTELYGARGLPLADSVRGFQPRQGQHATVADTWLQDPRVREKAGNYARNLWLKNGRALTVGEFKLYVNDYCLCVLDTKTSRYVRVASTGRTSAHISWCHWDGGASVRTSSSLIGTRTRTSCGTARTNFAPR